MLIVTTAGKKKDYYNIIFKAHIIHQLMKITFKINKRLDIIIDYKNLNSRK